MAGGAVRARPALATAALGAGLVVTAGLLDAEPLYVPGVAFLLLCAAAAVWVLAGAQGATVHRNVPVRRVLEEEPVELELVVTGRRPLPTGLLLEDLLGRPAPLPAGRRRARVLVVARFARRGRKPLTPPRVALRDPFGLVTWTIRGTSDEDELLVLPRLEPVVTTRGPGGAGAVGRRRGRPTAAAEAELDGLRQHQPGSPASRIFWPALARGGDLLERRMRADADTRPLVVLDPRGAADEADLDAAVRAAASLAHHLGRRGGCALLLPGDRRPAVLEPTLATWPHVHARLALVDGRQVPALGALLARQGEVLYVTARRTQRPPRALAQAPRGGRVLVVPAALQGRRAAFTVAGCHGYELSGARAPEAVA